MKNQVLCSDFVGTVNRFAFGSLFALSPKIKSARFEKNLLLHEDMKFLRLLRLLGEELVLGR